MRKSAAKILIIDDDEQIRRLLTDILSPELDCVAVSSGEEALAAIGRAAFDLVLSDIQMPGISGLQLVPQILERAPDTVVVMISGEQAIESAIEAMRAGAFDYVTKPLDLRHARAAVDRALNHQRLLAEKRRYENHLEEMVRERTAEIEHLAFHDRLTKLPNRELFLKNCEAVLSGRRRAGGAAALLLVSLDRFKRITDTLGHAAGDLLLTAAAERLQLCLSDRDTLARFDADEFGLLLADATENDAEQMARSINKVMKAVFHLAGDHEVFLTTSIGIASFPSNGEDAPTIVQNAAAALELAKQQGGNNHQLYVAEMNANALTRLGLETNLRRAVEANEFVTFYQPIVNLASGKTVGLEALVRWRHPRLGLLEPVDFISLAEDTGLILDIGGLVMSSACAQARQWHEQGNERLRIAINVSARQFRDKGFPERLVTVLCNSRLDPQCLELEITETTIIENFELATRALSNLRKLGIRVSIDDFGTGYSSLSYLKYLPVDTIKLDRSFVAGASSDPRDAALVMAIITLAHNLKLTVIAEGIETDSQRDFLHLLRCDEGQGYLYSRPAPADEVDLGLLAPKRKQNVLGALQFPATLRAVNE